MATETRRIKVEIKGSGSKELRKLAKGFDSISKSSKRTASSLERINKVFNRVFAISLAGVGLRSIVQTADSLQLLRDRIKVFEGDSADATFIKLGEAANYTKTSIENIAESYNRLALATKDLGLNSDALIGLTTALQQSFRLSGSSIAEASAATIQLSQGLASGQLRGQELRSVLEQNAVIGEILAKKFGTARGNLIKFAESGKITSRVVLEALAENAKRLNAEAGQLGQTFGQTLVIAFNKFNLEVDKVNRGLGLNSAFATGLEFIISNMDILATTITVIVSAAYLPSLIVGVNALTAAVFALGGGFTFLNAQLTIGIALAKINQLVNPTVAALSLLAGAVVFLAFNWERAEPAIVASVTIIQSKIQEFGLKTLFIFEQLARAVGLDSLAKKFKDASKDLRASLKETQAVTQTAFEEFNDLEAKANGTNFDKFADELGKAAGNLKNIGDGTDKFSDKLKLLNVQINGGKISIDQYNSKLKELKIEEASKQFLKGSKDLDSYNKEIEKLSGSNKLKELNDEFAAGTIGVLQYNQAINQLEVDRLKKGVEEGTASVHDLNKALLATQETVTSGTFKQGVADYVKSAGTLAQNVAGAVSNTFNTLEDSLLEFVQTGKFNFKSFTKSILTDLQRIIIRQLIVRQLANAITGGITPQGIGTSPAGGGSFNNVAAKGLAFNNAGLIPFASGGVVNSPTAFGFGGGKTGLMGEAGPEAILPLTRSSGGDLGVKATPSNVTVNIVNNTEGSEVQQRETSDSFGNKTIDVLIQTKVKEGFGNGSFDKTLKQAFGLDRKGI